MKKSEFIDGAFIATTCIIITKIMGILYVIPFYAIIGEHGGALYGYGYTVYNLFLIISSAGIPLAISKLTSEYVTLKQDKEKEYMFKIAEKWVFYFSFISFLICFFGANIISKIIIGDMVGGNTIEDISLVIRCISFSIIIVPLLSILRGYLQGHKYISASSFSQVIEQLIRIIIIIVGSYASMNIFNLSHAHAVAIAMSGATFSALYSYFYLKPKVNKIKTKTKDTLSVIEKKSIQKKILTYCIPFIAVNLSFYLYNTIDMLLVIRVLDYLNYNMTDIEIISSIFTTWGNKLISVVTAFATGIVISLIPSMVASHTKKDINEVNKQYKRTMEFLCIIILPIALLLSIYSREVWLVFYGESYYGPLIFKYLSILAFFDSAYIIMGCILQNLNKNKIIYTTIALGLGLNALLDIPLMLLFNKLDIYPYYGAIFASFIGFTIAVVYSFIKLKKEENIFYNFKSVYKNVLAMMIILIPVNTIIQNNISNINGRINLLFIFVLIGILNLILYVIINKNILMTLLENTKFGRKKVK